MKQLHWKWNLNYGYRWKVDFQTWLEKEEKDKIIYMLVLQNELFVFRAQNWNEHD